MRQQHALCSPLPPRRRRSLLVFLSLFVCKQGAQLVADSIDGVQPGLTLMIMQTVGGGTLGLLCLLV